MNANIVKGNAKKNVFILNVRFYLLYLLPELQSCLSPEVSVCY